MSGATSFTSLPNIDISGLRSQDLAERERVAGEIGKAADEVGFFYVSGAGVDDTLFERMLTATKQFFGLPLEEKMRYYIGLSKCHRSYVPSGEEGLATGMPEMKEAFDTALDLPDNDADYLAGNPMLGPNTWPELAGFAEVVSAYYQAVLDVGHRLLWAFAVALGRSRYVLQARNQDAEPVAPHPLPVVAFVATSHRVRKVRRTLFVPTVLQRRLPHRGETVAAVRLSRRQAAARIACG